MGIVSFCTGPMFSIMVCTVHWDRADKSKIFWIICFARKIKIISGNWNEFGQNLKNSIRIVSEKRYVHLLPGYKSGHFRLSGYCHKNFQPGAVLFTEVLRHGCSTRVEKSDIAPYHSFHPHHT
jgi:hypothetical protein